MTGFEQGNGYEFDGESLTPMSPEVTMESLLKAVEKARIAEKAGKTIDEVTTADDFLQVVDQTG